MNLSSANGSSIEPNRRIPFEFPPPSAPIPFPEVLQSFDPVAAGDDLDICDLADDLKHRIDRGGTRVGGSVTRISRDGAGPCERRLRHGGGVGLRERRYNPSRPRVGTIRRGLPRSPEGPGQPDRRCVRSLRAAGPPSFGVSRRSVVRRPPEHVVQEWVRENLLGDLGERCDSAAIPSGAISERVAKSAAFAWLASRSS
jgi:hypothetical protein